MKVYNSKFQVSIIFIRLVCFWDNTVFLANVYEMEVCIFIFVSFCNDCAGVDVWFCNFWDWNISRPIEHFVVKVIQSAIWNSVCHANVNTIWLKYAMNLAKHCGRVWCRIISWQNWVKACFIKHTVKSAVFKLKFFDIHYLPYHSWSFIFVMGGHLIYNCLRNINICNILIAIFMQILRKFSISTSNDKNFCARSKILSDNVFNSGVFLIPIKWLLIFLISIFPIFWFTVLCHIFWN